MTKDERAELDDFMDSVGVIGADWTERLENLVLVYLDKQEELICAYREQKKRITELETALQVQSTASWTPPAMMQ